MTRTEIPPVILLLDKLSTVTHHHLITRYDVLKHILGSSDEATTSTTIPPTSEWLKVDTIVLSWVFITLSNTLQERIVVEDPQIAKEAWDLIAEIFNDNKRTRTIALKAELRSLKLGDLSIDAYFRKIESISTILTSLGSPISNDDVVAFALEGLPDKYENVSSIIVHREPFLDLKTARSMLTTEEMRLKSKSQALPIDSLSSSPMIFWPNQTHPNGNNNITGSHNVYSFWSNGLSHLWSTVIPGYETILPQAFSVMTLEDPTHGAWNMDTGAISHINDSVTSLSDILNMCIYPSVSVGDGYTIPVTNTGHSNLRTPH
ncbi:hybrid signal transduction histidine kinase M [Tanacetum coccineum]